MIERVLSGSVSSLIRRTHIDKHKTTNTHTHTYT